MGVMSADSNFFHHTTWLQYVGQDFLRGPHAYRERKLDVGYVNQSVRSHLVYTCATSGECEYDMTGMDGGMGYYG